MTLYDQFSEQELDVLRRRAQRIASQFEDGQERDELPVLLITMREEHYALPVEAVRVVHERIMVERVPCTPPHVAGIANVRGHILPVIDLAAMLGMAPALLRGPVTLVVVGNEDVSMALYVDRVGEVVNLLQADIAAVPPTFAMEHTAALQGVLPDGTIVLDTARLLDDPALVVDEQVG